MRADDECGDDAVVVPIGPELDLHSFQPRDIPSVVDEYLHEAVNAGLAEVRLVHGRGRGVQRGIVQALLERHPLVAAFSDDPRSHLGATLVVLTRTSA
ncbi:MAG: Smr/MutS family protein [Acidobacteria bacterium]|nr:Smr/MutS family protein [Acidobacteriota bacterium]